MEYCKCRIPSPSAHHDNCINDGCGKRIKTIYQKYDELKEERDNYKRSLTIIRECCDICAPYYYEELDKTIDDEKYKIELLECEPDCPTTKMFEEDF